jgi:hypothetical protein
MTTWTFAIIDEDGIQQSDMLWIAADRWILAANYARSQLGADYLKSAESDMSPSSEIRQCGHAARSSDNLYYEIRHYTGGPTGDDGVTYSEWERM